MSPFVRVPGFDRGSAGTLDSADDDLDLTCFAGEEVAAFVPARLPPDPPHQPLRGPRHPAAPPPQPVREPPAVTGGLSLHPGVLRPGWCTACKAWTCVSTDLLLLSPAGVATAGTWSWCEICEDPDSPLPARRTDRA